MGDTVTKIGAVNAATMNVILVTERTPELPRAFAG
jgi:hypothetical protein